MEMSQLRELCSAVLAKLKEGQVHFYSANFKEFLEEVLDAILLSFPNKNLFKDRLVAEFCGHGPLEPYLINENITEILVNNTSDIWIEVEGKLQKIADHFLSPETYQQYLRVLLNNVGRRADAKTPFADARMPNGARLCVVVAPAAVNGPYIAIRKFSNKHRMLFELYSAQNFPINIKEYICTAITERKNILVSGATSTGKTTLLNALGVLVAHSERVVTLEDVAELNIEHPHVVSLEGRPPNIENEGEITLRQLVRTALRMRPDRIIVGECRGEEAWDILQALNTGHNGSMATIHANSARDALTRLELLAMLGKPNLSHQIIRSYVCGAIDIVIHLEKIGGERRIASIYEVSGLEENIYLLKEVFCSNVK